MPCIFNSFSNIFLRTKNNSLSLHVLHHLATSVLLDPNILNSNPHLSHAVNGKVSEPQVIADEYLVSCVSVLAHDARSHKHQIKNK